MDSVKYFSGNHDFSTYFLSLPKTTLVITGKISCSKSITIRVHRLIIFGEIQAQEGAKVNLEAAEEFISFGRIAAQANVQCNIRYDAISEEAMERIQDLGIQKLLQGVG